MMNALCLRKMGGNSVTSRSRPTTPLNFIIIYLMIFTKRGAKYALSKERTCDERHKWKFNKFGADNFHLLRFIRFFSGNLKLWLLQTGILETSHKHELLGRDVYFYFARREHCIAKSFKAQKMSQNNLTHQHGIGCAPTNYRRRRANHKKIGGGGAPTDGAAIIKNRRGRRVDHTNRRRRPRTVA